MDAKALGLQVLAELYPDQAVRDARATELGDAGLTALGNGVLRRQDHSRLMNETQEAQKAAEKAAADAAALYESNKAWFDQKQKDLQELDQLRQRVAAGRTSDPDPNNPNPPKAPDTVTADVFQKTLAETERGAVAFFTDLNTLSLQHFQQFGEVLDATKLLTNPKVQQIGLRGVYAEVYKPQLDAKAAEAAKAAEEKIRADERTKVLAAQASSRHPYPVSGNEPSALDAIEAARGGNNPAAKSVDDMVDEYARLSAARTGLGA